MKKTTDEFIKHSMKVHGERYLYDKVIYVNNKTHVELVCKLHGSFIVRPDIHLFGKCGCPECGKLSSVKKRTNTLEYFIKKSTEVHGDKYTYDNAVYINNKTPISISCVKHGTFIMRPSDHLQGKGCPSCYAESRFGETNSCYRGGVTRSNKPLYNTYHSQLKKYHKTLKVNEEGLILLGVLCMYCGKVYVPSRGSVVSRLQVINGNSNGALNLYCSNNCKKACPTFGKKEYPKGFKKATSLPPHNGCNTQPY